MAHENRIIKYILTIVIIYWERKYLHKILWLLIIIKNMVAYAIVNYDKCYLFLSARPVLGIRLRYQAT